jgi:hypothetical protein
MCRPISVLTSDAGDAEEEREGEPTTPLAVLAAVPSYSVVIRNCIQAVLSAVLLYICFG